MNKDEENKKLNDNYEEIIKQLFGEGFVGDDRPVSDDVDNDKVEVETIYVDPEDVGKQLEILEIYLNSLMGLHENDTLNKMKIEQVLLKFTDTMMPVIMGYFAANFMSAIRISEENGEKMVKLFADNAALMLAKFHAGHKYEREVDGIDLNIVSQFGKRYAPKYAEYKAELKKIDENDKNNNN